MRITSQDEHDDPATAKPLDKIYDEPLAIASAEPRDLAELFSHLGEFPSKTVPENSSGEQKKRKKKKNQSVLWNCSLERFWKEIERGGKITWGQPHVIFPPG